MIYVIIRWNGEWPQGWYDVPTYVGMSKKDCLKAAKKEAKIIHWESSHYLYKEYSMEGKEITSKRMKLK